MIQAPERRVEMSELCWLTDEQMARLQPYFPKSHGGTRRRVMVRTRRYTIAGSDRASGECSWR